MRDYREEELRFYKAVKSMCYSESLVKGREKGKLTDLQGEVVITNFSFYKNSEGKEYSVFIVSDDDKFYYGNFILDELFHKIENSGFKEELKAFGLPVVIASKKSKSGREYTSVSLNVFDCIDTLEKEVSEQLEY